MLAPALLVAALAQEPLTDTLVLDINTVPSFGSEFDPEPRAIAAFPDGRLLFTAQATFQSRRTYWVTNGAAGGTSELLVGNVELREPDGPNDPEGGPGAALPDGRLVFSAEPKGGDVRPYVTDGTPVGTLALPDSGPQFSLPPPRLFTPHQGEVWYLAYTSSGLLSDIGLFATDGSAPGTLERAGLPLSPGGLAEDDALLLASDGDDLLVAHSWVEDSNWVTDLWRSAGSSASTELLTTLPGRLTPGDSGQAFGSALVLLLGPGPLVPPDQLWSVHLGSGATELLFEGEPLAFAKSADERLFFGAGPGGSRTLFARQPGGSNVVLGLYSRLSNSIAGGLPSDVAVVDGVLLFGAEGAGSGSGLEPWRSDGTLLGTALLGDLEPGRGDSLPHGFAARPGEAFFGATAPATGSELYRTTGETNDVSLAADLTPGPEGGLAPGRMVALSGSTVYFGYRFEEQGEQLAAATPGGIGLVAEIGAALNETSLAQRMVSFRERLLFSADDGVHGTEPWISDGTPEGTQLLLDLQPGPQGSLPTTWVEFQGRLWFPASTEEHGRELWTTDGTAAGTTLFLDAISGPKGDVYELLANESWLCWIELESGVGENLWRTDGTLSGTQPIPDLGAGTLQGATILRIDGDTALVHAVDSSPGAPNLGRELYLIDLPTGSRQLLLDYHAGPLNSAIDTWASTPNFTLMLLDVPGTRLIVSDGTIAGSYELTSPEFPPFLTGTYVFGAWDGIVFFMIPGIALWRTDGTTAGTFAVASIPSLAGGVNQFDGRGGYAMIQDLARRIWRSDGTPSGTYPIAGPFELLGGSFSYSPILRSPAGTEGAYLFAGTEGATGEELWITSGEPGSERPLADTQPGPDSGVPFQVLRVGDNVFFNGNDGVTGLELHALPFAATGASALQAFGTGCSISASTPTLDATGPATLGSAVTVSLSDAAPNQPALLFRSNVVGALDLGTGCTLYALQPLLTSTLAIDASGAAASVLPVPAQGDLIGLRLALQAAILEPAGPFGGSFALSNGLEVLVGP